MYGSADYFWSRHQHRVADDTDGRLADFSDISSYHMYTDNVTCNAATKIVPCNSFSSSFHLQISTLNLSRAIPLAPVPVTVPIVFHCQVTSRRQQLPQLCKRLRYSTPLDSSANSRTLGNCDWGEPRNSPTSKIPRKASSLEPPDKYTPAANLPPNRPILALLKYSMEGGLIHVPYGEQMVYLWL